MKPESFDTDKDKCMRSENLNLQKPAQRPHHIQLMEHKTIQTSVGKSDYIYTYTCTEQLTAFASFTFLMQYLNKNLLQTRNIKLCYKHMAHIYALFMDQGFTGESPQM